MDLIFEWDRSKAKENLKKHKVGFEEGKTIFNDPFLLTFPDISSSEEEERFISIGLSCRERVLILIHTERQGRIRIISCRRAAARERRSYEEG
ncbi:MAG TPA: BrnT family toxin [Candidatus Sumerlaeota bacterium]|nr:BrnT family toxin [Candidatus Sumerlaeota bacterium]HOR28286.1 BrnT family toxin [Candidatus Sumerlaeota bacterium]HPK03331.1 BrnT family toxin [Candidatus Sumerlaeota bacterium]